MPAKPTEPLSPQPEFDPIEAFRHRDALAALGSASLFLSQVKPFSAYPFGDWVDTLKGQILRQHYFFSRIGNQLVGYYGWALTSHEAARDWIDNRRVLSYEECLDGPCVLIMANRALTRRVLMHQTRTIRALQAKREVAYWKRQTSAGVRLVQFNLQAPGVRRTSREVYIPIVG